MNNGNIPDRIKSKYRNRKIPGKLNTRHYQLHIDKNVPGVIQNDTMLHLIDKKKFNKTVSQ